MTLPDERYRALRTMRSALLGLFDTPGPIRKRELWAFVSRLLRHYPTDYDIERMRAKCKGIL